MSNLRTIKIRGDSTENWELANPILEYKEMACEFADNGTFFKIGNGIDSWDNLAYVSTVIDITDAEIKQKYENNPDTNAFTDDDKSKLSGIATGATKNDTDANLKNRANHTGTQDISTVSGLQSALDSKEVAFIKNTAFNKNFGTTADTVAQGNDARLSDAREWTASEVLQAEAEGGTETTARKWTAQRVRQAITAWWNTIGTAFGKTLLGSADAEDARQNLGLGTAATRDVVGTVSQSGGVPTGAIIERGSNANGEFVKFADGTQICYLGDILTNTNVGTVTTDIPVKGSYEKAITGIALPASFINIKYVVSADCAAYAGDSVGVFVDGFTSTTSSISIRFTTVSSSTFIGRFNATVVGRWY